MFERLSCPTELSNSEVLEQFVVVLYKRTSDIGSVNKARQFLFATWNRKIENIPPSQAALVQHIRRVVYQAGFVWGQSLSPCPVLPDPGEWGWMGEYSLR